MSESKQLAGYIWACSIALLPSSSLLAGLVVQNPLTVLLCQYEVLWVDTTRAAYACLNW